MASGVGYAIGTFLGSRTSVVSPRMMVVLSCLMSGLGVGALLLFQNVPMAVCAIIFTSFVSSFAGIAMAAILAAESPAGTGTTMVLSGSVLNLGSALGALLGGVLLSLGTIEPWASDCLCLPSLPHSSRNGTVAASWPAEFDHRQRSDPCRLTPDGNAKFKRGGSIVPVIAFARLPPRLALNVGRDSGVDHPARSQPTGDHLGRPDRLLADQDKTTPLCQLPRKRLPRRPSPRIRPAPRSSTCMSATSRARSPATPAATRGSRDLIRAAGSDVIINMSTGGGAGQTTDERTHRNRCPSSRKLPRSIAAPATSARPSSSTRPHSSTNSPQRMNDNGVLPEIECFEPGHVANAIRLIDEGKLTPPFWFQVVLNVRGGSPGTVKQLLHMVEMLPDGAHLVGLRDRPRPAAAQSGGVGHGRSRPHRSRGQHLLPQGPTRREQCPTRCPPEQDRPGDRPASGIGAPGPDHAGTAAVVSPVRIAAAQIQHETNVFSPVRTDRRRVQAIGTEIRRRDRGRARHQLGLWWLLRRRGAT